MNDTPPPNEPEEQEPADHEESDTVEEFVETGSTGGFNGKPLLIVAVLVAILFFIQAYRKGVNREARQEAELREAAIANSAVALSVTWSNEKRLPLFEVTWSPGLTVRDLMLTAQDEGALTFEETGEGDAAMLTAIGDTTNEGAGTDSQNWIFRVNGKMADRSFAIYELEKGDIVSWEFSTYE